MAYTKVKSLLCDLEFTKYIHKKGLVKEAFTVIKYVLKESACQSVDIARHFHNGHEATCHSRRA
jgi:hypothetical protein